MTRHLGDLAAALVDGELGHDARDRALAHLAGCDECRAEVAGQRRLKARIARLAEIGAALPVSLGSRLDALAGERAALAGERAALAGTGALAGTAGFAGTAGRPVSMRVAVAGVTGALTLGGLAFLAGGDNANGRPVRPAVNQFVYQHVATVNPLSGQGAVDVSFTSR